MKIVLEKAKNSELTLCSTINGRRSFYHSSYNPTKEAINKIKSFTQRIHSASEIILFGFGLGYTFFELIHHVNKNQKIFIFEPSLEVAHILNEHFSHLLTEINKNPNCFFFSSDNKDQFFNKIQHVKQDECFIIEHDFAVNHYQKEYQALLIAKKISTIKCVFFMGAGIVTPNILNDLKEALEILNYEIYLTPLNSETDYTEFLNMICPKFIFDIDRKAILNSSILDYPCPKITWFVDNPFYFINDLKPNSNEIILTWDQFYIPFLKQYGFNKIFHFPLATNFNQLKHSELKSEQSVDVCFIGSIGKDIESIRKKRLTLLSQVENTIIDSIIHSYRNIQNINDYRLTINSIQDLYNSHFKNISKYDYFIDYEADSGIRRTILQSISQFNCCFYGNDNLKNIIDEKKFYGSIPYQEIPNIYKKSKITINSTRPQLKITLNQRLLDAPLCNALPLTDYRPDLETYFKELFQEICYFTGDELVQKIQYYLSHDSERQAIIHQMKDIIIHEHTYQQRAQFLDELITDTLL